MHVQSGDGVRRRDPDAIERQERTQRREGAHPWLRSEPLTEPTRDVTAGHPRVEVSQQDEIEQMTAWLERRGEPVPGAGQGHGGEGEHGAGHGHHAEHLSGMLTPEQMASLASARGQRFDRLFLELMIQHHLGALEMVDELMASPGAGQEVDVFRIAAEVDSDQRIEIERMERMLETIG